MMSVVIIPAYRPDETLAQLAGRLWLYGCRIVVVDDGSGEAYRSIFSEIGELCTVLRHSKNRGKGAAIKTALSYIRENLPDCDVIGIMDADGQHLPEDMMRLIKWAFERKNTLMLGVRAVGSRMPLRSRLGNRITRTVFRLLSGVKISDTQSGLRAFRRELLEKILAVGGERYEYEMNVLLKLRDTSQQEAVRAAVEARLETQKTSFDGYGLEQYDLLTNHSILDIRGNYVLFVVHKDAAAVQQAFRGAL